MALIEVFIGLCIGFVWALLSCMVFAAIYFYLKSSKNEMSEGAFARINPQNYSLEKPKIKELNIEDYIIVQEEKNEQLCGI